MSEESIIHYKVREQLVRTILREYCNDAKVLIETIPKEILNDYKEGEYTILHDICYLWPQLGYDKEDMIEVCELLLSKLTRKTINLNDEEGCSALDIVIRDKSYELCKLIREAKDRLCAKS